MESPIKMDDLGVPLFSETSLYVSESNKSGTEPFPLLQAKTGRNGPLRRYECPSERKKETSSVPRSRQFTVLNAPWTFHLASLI